MNKSIFIPFVIFIIATIIIILVFSSRNKNNITTKAKNQTYSKEISFTYPTLTPTLVITKVPTVTATIKKITAVQSLSPSPTEFIVAYVSSTPSCTGQTCITQELILSPSLNPSRAALPKTGEIKVPILILVMSAAAILFALWL